MAATAVVLQARMGSRRLPGKVLARLGRATLLERCVRRLAVSGLPIVVATTRRPDDDAVEEEAQRLNVDVFRGDEDDVLGRFIGAARAFGATTVVRATADNPFVDGESASRLLPLIGRVQADHVLEGGLPIGAAVEVVTLAALEQSQAFIFDPYDREHVTSFIRRDHRFRALRLLAPRDARRPGLRLTVDTQEDLDFARALWGSLSASEGEPRLAAVIRAAQMLPPLAETQSKRGA